MKRPFVAEGYSFSRPANTTAYVAGDAVSNSATDGLVGAMRWIMERDATLLLERLRLTTSDTGFADVAVRAWIFSGSPQADGGVVGADNEAFSSKRGNFLGTMSGILFTFSDGAAGILTPDDGSRIIHFPSSNIFALLETLSAATPLSGSTFKGVLEGELDS